MVAYGAAVFALIVSTICAGLIWKSNTISLATKDAILSSVAAALFLMIFLFPGNLLDDYGTTFALILLALGVLIGVVGKQLFTFIVRMIRIEVRASQG